LPSISSSDGFRRSLLMKSKMTPWVERGPMTFANRNLEGVAVGGYEALGAELGGGVERDGDERPVVLRGGNILGLAVDDRAGRERYLPDAGRPHGLQQVEGGKRPLPEVCLGHRGTQPDVRVGGEVVYHLLALDGLAQRRRVEEVAMGELEVPVAPVMGDELIPAGGQVVEHGYGVAPGLEKPVHQVASDEPRPAGHEMAHVYRGIIR